MNWPSCNPYFRRVTLKQDLGRGPDGCIDAVGMVVVSFDSPATAQQWANDDDAVKAGLLDVTVRPWLVPMQRGLP